MTKKLECVIRAQDFDKEMIEAVFAIAADMESGIKSQYKEHMPSLSDARGRIMSTLFYEPSTRTRFSFESAMLRLGGMVIGSENANEFSSRAKGESLADTVRVISAYCDVIVLRHRELHSAQVAQKYATVPIINAGDGPGQHPTQALLDLYTIYKKFPAMRDLNIVMAGDLMNGRTVRSLSYFLAKHYPHNTLYFVSPPQTRMGDDIKSYLAKHNVTWREMHYFEDALIRIADVIYQTRVQQERFEHQPGVYGQIVKASEKLRINSQLVQCMHKDAMIMHPLPRLNEIDIAVDHDSRAMYFDQAENGLYVRMALLKMIFAGY